MFPASTAITSTMPRAMSQPLRRVAATMFAAVTVLALLAASAVPSRAEGQGDTSAMEAIRGSSLAEFALSLNKARAKPAPAPVPVAPVQVRAPRVPSVCAIEIAGARRDITVYPERCLRRTGFDYRLPRHCATTARIFGRTDRVYAENCLREAGFRVEGGRGHDRGFRDHGRGHGRDHGYGRPRHAY